MTVLRMLMDKSDAEDGDEDRAKALAALNVPLGREGYEAYFDDRVLHVRHRASKTISTAANPHRPFTPEEAKRRELLAAYLDSAPRMSSLREFCCHHFGSWGISAYRLQAIRIRLSNTVRTFGCGTRCPRSMCFTSEYRQKRGSWIHQA
jgi:hypothetical protein